MPGEPSWTKESVTHFAQKQNQFKPYCGATMKSTRRTFTHKKDEVTCPTCITDMTTDGLLP